MDSVIEKTKKYECELGCKVITSPYKTTEICLSKSKTYQALSSIVSVPKIYSPDNIDKSEFPIFAKPDIGYGARGARRLDSLQEVNEYVSKNLNMLILEYLPGDEYTVDCFTNKEGELLYCAARQRRRVSNGISVNTYFVDNQKDFLTFAEKLNSKLVFRGAWFFQVKRDKNGTLVLLEVAARLGGSSLLSKAKGVNLSLLSLFDAFDYKVTITTNDYFVELDRALNSRFKADLQFDSVYCDYDDCLILDKKIVNIELVGFLYKCLNEKKKLILLSKHTGTDLISELVSYRINGIFDEIINIDVKDDKAKYIKSNNAIFIDDSNSERQNIKSKLNIPVFSPDMIDVLL